MRLDAPGRVRPQVILVPAEGVDGGEKIVRNGRDCPMRHDPRAPPGGRAAKPDCRPQLSTRIRYFELDQNFAGDAIWMLPRKLPSPSGCLARADRSWRDAMR